jgi:hypothetical protein
MAIYLAVYSAAILAIGPSRLFDDLGQDLYNAIVAKGSPGALLVFLAIWALPVCLLALFWYLSLGRLLSSEHVRKRVIAATVGALLTATLAQVVLLDGWPGTLLSWVEGHDTRYAAGYTPLGFLRVRRGMTEAEVIDLLGRPLDRYAPAPDSVSLSWTRSAHKSNYRVRVVVLRAGRVASKHSELYMD